MTQAEAKPEVAKTEAPAPVGATSTSTVFSAPSIVATAPPAAAEPAPKVGAATEAAGAAAAAPPVISQGSSVAQTSTAAGNTPEEDETVATAPESTTETAPPQPPALAPLPPEPEQPAHIPHEVDESLVEDVPDDASMASDSAYESDSSSQRTESVTSSIYNYTYENGRRYHAYREGQYLLPNDEMEQERLDLQHHIWLLLLHGKLYTAPLPQPAKDQRLRILDLGCGTGIWAIDMAEEFEKSEVYGVDLSPIQPTWVPGNCFFHVDDYEDEWTYRDSEKFDYIHGRALSGTSSDWDAFYRKIMDNLKPGGYVEMQEYDAWIFSDDDSCDRATNTMNWVEKLDEGCKMFGKQINVARFHKQWMQNAGFEDVQEVVYRIPIGPWTKDSHLKELGKYELIHMQMSVDSHTPAPFSRAHGYTEKEIQVLTANVKREFRNNKELHLLTSYRFLTGRKPLS